MRSKLGKWLARMRVGRSPLAGHDDFSRDTMRIMLAWRSQIELRQGDELVHTLVLGPCYGRYDWYLGPDEVNLSWGGQDLYMSYGLFRRFSALLPGLKNVVLFFGVFSPGQQNEFTGFFSASVLARMIFGVPYHNEIKAAELRFDEYERAYAGSVALTRRRFTDVAGSPYFGLERKACLSDARVAAIARGHHENNVRRPSQLVWLARLFEEAAKRSVSVTVVIPPLGANYRAGVPAEEALFRDLYQFAGSCGNVQVVSLYDDADRAKQGLVLTAEDFADYEHLSVSGARKLSECIRPRLRA